MSWASPADGPSAGPTVAGVMLGARYQLIGPIAAGGMARVWSARDVQLDRDVAIKILHPHLVTDEGFVTRFRREAVASARLSHRSIVSVYDTISADGVEAIVMELIDGQTLRELLDEKGALSARDVIDIGRQIAEALSAAHATGLVHRDIKPANIMVREDGRVLVADFGIAKAADDADLTSTGTLLGTAKYLSPEQVTGGPVDPRSDLYSLGVVLFESLTGTVPFKANTDAATALARLHQEPPSVSQIRPNVPGDLEVVINRLMARDLQGRFARALDVATALSNVDLLSAPLPVASGQGGVDDPTVGLRPPGPPASSVSPFGDLRPPDPPRTPVVLGGQAMGQLGPTTGFGSGPGVQESGHWPPPASPFSFPGSDPSVELLDTRTGVAVSTERVSRSKVVPAVVVGSIAAGLILFGILLLARGWGAADQPINPFIVGGPGLPIASATSFDPQSSDAVKKEREEIVGLAYDGDVETAWTSEPYKRRQLGGLKDGVGLLLSLDEPLPLNEIELETRSEDWQLDIYVADSFSDDPTQWGIPAASIDAGSNRQVRELGRAEGSVVLLWIRDTGQSEAGRFQFVLAEVTIR